MSFSGPYNQGGNPSHPRAYSSDFSDDFGETDPWYSQAGSPEKPLQQQMNYSNESYSNPVEINPRYSGRFDLQEQDYSSEPPLLEEIGIRFDHIWEKTQAVILLNQRIGENILDDADLAGPLVYSFLLGGVLLLSGKIHFGYIYGLSVFGCLTLTAVINLLDLKSEHGIDIWRTASVLGYSMLPIIGLAVISIILSLKGLLGVILSLGVIGWSTAAATRIFDSRIHLTEQFWLVAYPTMLFYSCFVLLAIF